MKKTLILIFFVFILVGCSDREIIRESQITTDILNDPNYLGRLPEHPDRIVTYMYYYNTKKLHFYIYRYVFVSNGKSLTPILMWQYITLERLKKKIKQ